ANEFGSAGMCGMSFDNDGTAGSQSRGGIAAADGIGQWEIARAEDDDGANGDKHAAQVHFWQRFAVRLRAVYGRLNPGAFTAQFGEHCELVGSAVAFGGEALLGQTGFKARTLDEFIAEL